MMVIGLETTIAFFVEETGDCRARQLNHSDAEAERFYRV